MVNYIIWSFSICLLSAFLGSIVITFASECLNFALLSIPVFFLFTGISLLHYLEAIDRGDFKYLLPVQGGLDLIGYTGRSCPPLKEQHSAMVQNCRSVGC